MGSISEYYYQKTVRCLASLFLLETAKFLNSDQNIVYFKYDVKRVTIFRLFHFSFELKLKLH